MTRGKLLAALSSARYATLRAYRRKKLGRDDNDARTHRQRPLRRIVAPVKFDVSELLTGGEIAIFPRDGGPRIGRVLALRRRNVTFALWGGPIQTFEFTNVRYFRLVGQHTWIERREVAERQRRGDPPFWEG